jgi:hypothetical protein
LSKAVLGGGMFRWMIFTMKEMRSWYKISVESLKGRNHFEDLDLDMWIILKWIIKKEEIMV